MENLNQKKSKLCSKCGRKPYLKNMFLEANGLCNFCNSIGKPCANCKKNDKGLQPNGLCDFCFFGSREQLEGKHESTNNVWDTIKAILGVLFLIFLIWWIYIQVQGLKGQPECPYGYHLEEDFRQITSGCIPN
ncbi:MAG: hypothetical protein WC839_03455 [Candidatus Paceibacterota bacterium]